LMLILGIVLEDVLSFSADIYTFYNEYEFIPGTGLIGGPTPTVQFTLTYVGVLISTFLLLSAVAHLLIAFPLNKYYERNLKKKINPIRWLEYALSSSIMISFIAVLFGVFGFWQLVMIFVLNALMNMFGYMMELHNQTTEKTNWTAYILGWVAGIVPWIVITAYFVNTVSIGGEIPTFVYIIYFVQFAFFFLGFAMNMFLQYAKIGPWKDYAYGERGYQILSLVSKSILAWLVFFGIFQP
ncbi:MAG: heliorhodopsin HeR, partial [Candidatus Odinarchaeota archaeon]